MTWMASKIVQSIKSSAGFIPKQYGTMKAAMAKVVAVTAVFIGLDFAMALPA